MSLSAAKPIRLSGLFYLVLVVAALCAIGAYMADSISASDKDSPIEDVFVLSMDGCSACETLKAEWRANTRTRDRIKRRAKVQFASIETVPALVRSDGSVVAIASLSDLERGLNQPRASP